jgi:hypothetical protein
VDGGFMKQRETDTGDEREREKEKFRRGEI